MTFGMTLVRARNKTVILLSSQHLDDLCMSEQRKMDHKPKITMHNNATKSNVDVMDKLVQDEHGAGLFLKLTDVAW
jgi:hypothetical protein